jgi:(3,5-dihydroxyphenyl)acetyl-CoA 1,2-dioxygenase
MCAAAVSAEVLNSAGLGPSATAEWNAAKLAQTSDFESDIQRFGNFWKICNGHLAKLPKKPARNSAESAAAAEILLVAREHREKFLTAHAETLYDRLTQNRSRFLRLEKLVFEAAAAVPGLTPTKERLNAEQNPLQRDKDGLEIDQGIFLAHVLASERTGFHLCHAMLLPRSEAKEYLVKLDRDGTIDLGPASVQRIGKAAHLTMKNPRYLNAEDQTTLDLTEIAVDVAILDPATEIAVMRGGVLENPKYAGRRAFGAGINLTHLYRGLIPFVWFLQRDMGYVHKILRGVARPEALPDDVHGVGIEKPWIAVVDTFAIGGHCQILLTMDYVLAADDAFMTLPARKEGIIPGLANLRLPKFTGDRIARQAIQYERRLDCNSPEGRLICDEIAPASGMGRAIERLVDGLTSSGAVSAVSNRRAFRIGQEPLDQFRRYCSAYARDQAYCCFSPALIANLERNWDAKNRKI